MAFVPPPRPGTMATSAVVEISLLTASGVVSGRSAIRISSGPGVRVRRSFKASLSPRSSCTTRVSPNGNASVARMKGSHPASRAATTTSQSISWANFSRSSWSSTQESRVFGFLGLKGMTAGTATYLPGWCRGD